MMVFFLLDVEIRTITFGSTIIVGGGGKPVLYVLRCCVRAKSSNSYIKRFRLVRANMKKILSSHSTSAPSTGTVNYVTGRIARLPLPAPFDGQPRVVQHFPQQQQPAPPEEGRNPEQPRGDRAAAVAPQGILRGTAVLLSGFFFPHFFSKNNKTILCK